MPWCVVASPPLENITATADASHKFLAAVADVDGISVLNDVILAFDQEAAGLL